MPSGRDTRGDIHLHSSCTWDRIKEADCHDARLDNLTDLRLFDAHFKVNIPICVDPILGVSYGGATFSHSSQARHGAIGAGKSARKEFLLERSGHTEGVEVVTTVSDWAREASDPLIGIPPKRFFRACIYHVEVGD